MAQSGKPLTPQEAQHVQKLREAGLSHSQIAREARVSESSVQKILKSPVDKQTN